tara:strand:- start:3651 stop:5048 length:1398 start_codon:yes stop_codon:yes gene_type:complete
MKKQAFFYYLALYEEFFFNIESKMKIMEIFNKFRQLAKKLQEFRKERFLIILGSASFILFVYIAIAYNSKLKEERFEAINSFLLNNDTILLKNYFLNQVKSPYLEYEYLIKEGDTIETILKKFSIKSSEVDFIVKKIKKMRLTDIKTGQKISFLLKKSIKTKEIEILNVNYPLSKETFVQIDKKKDKIEVTKNVTKLFKKEIVQSGKITTSLYKSAINAGIEPNIIIEFARIFGFEVDFQRDIRKGDEFEILFERFTDDRNKSVKTGKILYAYLNVNNQKIKLYRFGKKSNTDYFDEDGKSISKALMKTPINGARLSSGFGNRKHPILGFTKHHNGTDFAAPTGTPIMASGTGTVIKAGWCGNGGNCVRIRHNSSYTTGYGHLSKFATKTGRRVTQGQIIGYVGNTGMSTGPHLHYTVKYNGKFINSQKLKLPSGRILKGNERKDFEVERIKLDVKLAELKSYKR